MTLPGFHECPECGGEGIDRPEGCLCPRFSDTDFRIADLTCRVHGVNGYVAQPDDDWKPCPECGGAGQVPDDDTVEVVADRVQLMYGLFRSPRYGGTELRRGEYQEIQRVALLAYAHHTQETKP